MLRVIVKGRAELERSRDVGMGSQVTSGNITVLRTHIEEILSTQAQAGDDKIGGFECCGGCQSMTEWVAFRTRRR